MLEKCLCSVPSEHKDALPKGKSCFESVTDVNSNSRTALHIADRYDEHECVQTLLTRGANIEARDSDQKTPIQLALEMYRCKSIKILVEAKADIDHLTWSEQTKVGRCMDEIILNS